MQRILINFLAQVFWDAFEGEGWMKGGEGEVKGRGGGEGKGRDMRRDGNEESKTMRT